MFYEIVVAPGYTPEGLEVLKGKSKALRILEAKPRAPSGRSLRQIAGGWLLQVGFLCVWGVGGWGVVTSEYF
jgi:phosphoribosylaminoimidazolecarboxamide formyltransferase/IMP cyclohydrolase